MILKVTADTPVEDRVKNHPGTRLCTGTCQRWTRGSEMPLADYPNTVIRASAGKCQKCLNDERRAEPAYRKDTDAKHRDTVTALESYLNRRRPHRERMMQS